MSGYKTNGMKHGYFAIAWQTLATDNFSAGIVNPIFLT
jgi:hypothetical protein